MYWSSPGSPTLDVSHMTFTLLFLTTDLCIRKLPILCLFFLVPKLQAIPLILSHQLGTTVLLSPSWTVPTQQVHNKASAESDPNTSQTLPNHKFWMVTTQNQRSDQLCLKASPVSFKPCYKLQQTESGFWLSCETCSHMCSTWFGVLLWISCTALRE